MTDHEHDPDDQAAAETAAAEAEWNPLHVVNEETKPLRSSGGRATLTLRSWSGRERLAYEDAVSGQWLIQATAAEGNDDASGGISMQTMRTLAASITLVGSSGFPPRADGSVMFTGDWRKRREDLLSLNPQTFAEVRSIAVEFQPLPTTLSIADEEADEEDGESESEGEDGGDPFPTPSTLEAGPTTDGE